MGARTEGLVGLKGLGYLTRPTVRDCSSYFN